MAGGFSAEGWGGSLVLVCCGVGDMGGCGCCLGDIEGADRRVPTIVPVLSVSDSVWVESCSYLSGSWSEFILCRKAIPQ